MWRDSYLSNLSFLGIIYYLFLLCVVYSNVYNASVIYLFISVFIFFRLVQIQKLFVIFVPDFGSLLYLILYLCGVEILPGLLLYKSLISLFTLV